MAGNGNPKSMANLKMIKPGEVRNPNGRKGAFSLKTSYKKWLSTMDEPARNAMWDALYVKACSGDTKAIAMIIELNDERVIEDVQVDTDNGVKISITMPSKSEEE
jgi:hypothetical protein